MSPCFKQVYPYTIEKGSAKKNNLNQRKLIISVQLHHNNMELNKAALDEERKVQFEYNLFFIFHEMREHYYSKFFLRAAAFKNFFIIKKEKCRKVDMTSKIY